MQENFMEMVAGLKGDHALGSRQRVLPHKKKACGSKETSGTGACKGHMAVWLAATGVKDRTECEACRLIIGDVDALLFRERSKVPTKQRLGQLLEPLCQDLAMRHENPAFLEEHCDDLLDELQGDAMREEDSVLVGNIKLRKRLETAGLTPSNTLAEKVCTELKGYCKAPAVAAASRESTAGGGGGDGEVAAAAAAAAAAGEAAATAAGEAAATVAIMPETESGVKQEL